MNKNIKIVSYIFSISFLVIISTLIYFLVFRSNYYNNHPLNKRLFIERDRYVRGKILDRDSRVIAYSNEENNKRVYPYGESLFHPVGYLDSIYGISGIEKELDEYLKEPRGFLSRLNIFLNKEEKYGSNVKLTIHSELQKYVYDLLGDKKGSVVLMNPKSGEIYAMVSKPAIDPNDIKNLWGHVSKDENAPLYNRAINGKYPPGSTFKIITLAASIESIEGVLNRVFEDKGYIDFGEGERLYNQNKKAYNNISLREGFINSSNVVFGNLALELGNDKIRKYAEKFYFNREILCRGICISKSHFPKLEHYQKGLIAQTGIGQGSILATPIILAMVSNVIANDGILKAPYIVSEILNSNSNIINKTKSKVLSRVIKSKTSKNIRDYMRDIVNNNLFHIQEFKDIKAAGKTGTADYKKDNRDGIPHSLFVGFAPYDNPKVSIATIIEEGGEGRGIASQISAKALKKAIEVIE